MPGDYTAGGVGSRIKDAEQAEHVTRELDATEKLIQILQSQIKSYEDGNRGIKKIHAEEVEILRSLILAIRKGNDLAREQLQRGKNPKDYIGNLQSASGIIDPSNRAARLSKKELTELNIMFQRTATATNRLTAAERRRLQELDKQNKMGMSKDVASVIGMLGGRFGGLAALAGGVGGLSGGMVAIKQASDLMQDALEFSDNLVKFGVEFRETIATPGGKGGTLGDFGSAQLAVKLDTMVSVMTNNIVSLKDLNKTIQELKNLGGAGIPLFAGGMSANQIFEGLVTAQRDVERGDPGHILSRARFNNSTEAKARFGGGDTGYYAYRKDASERVRVADEAKGSQTLMLKQLAAFQVGLSALSRVTGMSEGGLLKYGVTLNRTTALFDNMRDSVQDLLPQLTEEMKKLGGKTKTDKEALTAMEGVNMAATLAAIGFQEFDLPQEEFVNNLTSSYQSARLFGLSIYDLIGITDKEKVAMRAMIISLEDITRTMNTMFSPGIDQAALMMEYLRNNLSQFSDLAPLTNMNQLDAMGLISDLAQVPTEWLDDLESRRQAGEQTEPVKMWTTYMQGAGLKSISDFKNLQGSARNLSGQYGGGLIDMMMGGKNVPGSGFMRRYQLDQFSPGMKMGGYKEQLTTAETQKLITDVASGVASSLGEKFTRQYAENIVKSTQTRDFPAEFRNMAELLGKSVKNLFLNGPITISGLAGGPRAGIFASGNE